MLMTLDVIFKSGTMMLINGPRNQSFSIFIDLQHFGSVYWLSAFLLRLGERLDYGLLIISLYSLTIVHSDFICFQTKKISSSFFFQQISSFVDFNS